VERDVRAAAALRRRGVDGFAFLLWITILRFLPAGTASLNMFAIPVIALVSSMLVFGERLTPRSGWASRASARASHHLDQRASAAHRDVRPQRPPCLRRWLSCG
jgi:hypothetical protein